MTAWTTLVTTFLAACVEVIEMVIIVVGVGSVRGWRSTIIGAVAGFGVLTAVVGLFGTALTAVPIGLLRLVIGALLLVFGLQWLRKGIRRVAANGFAGSGDEEVEAADRSQGGIDWTSFVLAFKGVLLEGLEVSFIVVSFGATSGHLGLAVVGGAAAFVVIGVAGALARATVQRIPRSALQLIVGVMLASFGTFWAAEGVGVSWPGSDAAILGLLVLYVATAVGYVAALRAGALGARQDASGDGRGAAMAAGAGLERG
jgi:uncharacterized membrane protein